MPSHKVRRQFSLESLERRDTPSAGFHGHFHPAVRHHVVPISGTATVTLTGANTGVITNGFSPALGSFTGTVNPGSVTLTGSNGTLNATFVGTAGKTHNGRAPFHGAFHVVSGNLGTTSLTGGQGNVNGTIVVSGLSGQVRIGGRLVE